MKKQLLPLALLLVANSAIAQNVLDTVKVSANHAQSPMQLAARTINLLQTDELQNNAPVTINEALEQVASLDVRQRSPFNVQADISVRGGTFEQTLVLLNGMRINDPQTGHHNMNLPVALEAINQIEVLEGGAARVYGPNAFAGAINLQTSTQGKNSVFVKSLGGAYGLFGANAMATYNTGKFYTLVAGNYSQSDGYITNTDFKNTNIFAQTTGTFNHNKLTLMAGYNSKGFGAQDFYSSRYAEQFEATKTIFGAAKFYGSVNQWSYQIAANWRQHNDKFELFREDKNYYTYTNGFFVNSNSDTAAYAPGFYYPGHNYHQTRVFGADGHAKYHWQKAGTTTIGFDYRNEQILSNNLGKPLSETIPVAGERGSYTKSDVRDNYAAFFEHYVTLNKWLITIGGLVNYNTSFGTDFMPGIDVAYRATTKTLLYASVDRSFRLPTFTDLYYNLGGATGSQNLQPEYSLNVELGARYTHQNISANVAVFKRQGTNLIDWVQWTPDSLHAENLTEVNMNGFTLNGGLKLADKTNGWIKHVHVGYTFLKAEEATDTVQSLYVLDYLNHKFTLGLAHKIFTEKLTGYWQVNYQNRNGSYVDYPTQQTVTYNPFCLVDAKINYAFKRANVFVSVYNLFDVAYVDRGNVAQPGVWYSAGFSVTF